MSDEFREKIAGEITLAAEPGKTIRKWREEFGLSQYELADAMGVSHSVISDYESGRRKSPGVAVIRKMVDAFLKLTRSLWRCSLRPVRKKTSTRWCGWWKTAASTLRRR